VLRLRDAGLELARVKQVIRVMKAEDASTRKHLYFRIVRQLLCRCLGRTC
jgi:hypothetical protein